MLTAWGILHYVFVLAITGRFADKGSLPLELVHVVSTFLALSGVAQQLSID